MTNHYLKEFFGFRCAGDILSACGPINNGDKEITEAMAIRTHLKGILLKDPMRWAVIDLCSGNALVPILSTFTLPSRYNLAVDKRPRERNWEQVRRFQYRVMDIHHEELTLIKTIDDYANVILTSVHCCGSLAPQVIKIFQKSQAQHLIMMPCCVGPMKRTYPDFIRQKLGRPTLWGLHLSEMVGGDLHEDKRVLPPRNLIITASKV